MSDIVGSLYEKIHLIGCGHFSKVYLGRHIRLEKYIVLKAYELGLFKSDRDYRKEVEKLKYLNHTYIPQVYDFFQEDGIYYAVMDYIEGEDFDKRLKGGESYDSQQIVVWAKQILEALVYLHSPTHKSGNDSNGVTSNQSKNDKADEHGQNIYSLDTDNTDVKDGMDDTDDAKDSTETDAPAPFAILHSDIKPANIILTPQGDIRLVDFNVALALRAEGGKAVGKTPPYASPEHYGMDYSKNGKSDNTDNDSTVIDDSTVINDTPKASVVIDARSDIYGLGATLYHLLKGEKPDMDATKVEPLTPDKNRPFGMTAIINKAMSPDRTMRYQTAQDMLDAFSNIHRDDPRNRRFRRYRGITAAVLAAALVMGAFTAFVGLSRIQWDKNVRALVEESQTAYSRGNMTDAVRLALEAVPPKSDLFTPPVSASAKKALADALGVYDLSDGFKLHKTVSLPSVPLMAVLSPDGKTAAVVYAYETAVVDLESGQIRFTLPLTRSALAEARFLNSTTLVCAGFEGLCAYDISAEVATRLWSGSSATTIAISADGGTIAAINRDDDFATLYDAQGGEKSHISFDGRIQRMAVIDSFANPRDNVFTLSDNGEFLAVSFDDGSFSVYDTLTQEILLYLEPDEEHSYVRFEGGFSGNLLALSAASAQTKDLVVFDMGNIDIYNPQPLVSYNSTSRFGVITDEDNIYVSLENKVMQLDPASDKQRVLTSGTDSYIRGFAVGGGYTLTALEEGCVFYDKDGRIISRHDRDYPTDIILTTGDYALIGGRDLIDMTILKLASHNETELLAFDSRYPYLEARVKEDGSRFMLFSSESFRLYNSNNALICEQLIPDYEQIYDKQYSKASGNLVVMYQDALRIYSGNDGRMIFSETGLRSVFYAPYGVSILNAKGQLRLIDVDSGAAVFSTDLDADEPYAAYCGVTVDSVFLAGRKLIGAVKTSEGYLFAVSDGVNAALYGGNGEKRFDFPVRIIKEGRSNDEAEAFFTGTAVIISPMHSPAAAYSLKDGSKICDLERDAYLTYVRQIGDYIVSQYLSTDGEQFGILLDSKFRPVAYLPHLYDTWKEKLVFCYQQGVMRQSRIYSFEELLKLAETQEA